MKNESVKTGAKIGAIVGVVLWFVFGIMGGIHFGGYSTIILMNKLFGPIEATLITRTLVVMGMAVGVMTLGSLCLVIGGVLGALFGWVVYPVGKLDKSSPSMWERIMEKM
jgi:uncharacterized membrane protein YvlD (DUF360 family)